ncbi:hypothetical protein JZ751_024165, partial [Albula glossodonta]
MISAYESTPTFGSGGANMITLQLDEGDIIYIKLRQNMKGRKHLPGRPPAAAMGRREPEEPSWRARFRGPRLPPESVGDMTDCSGKLEEGDKSLTQLSEIKMAADCCFLRYMPPLQESWRPSQSPVCDLPIPQESGQLSWSLLTPWGCTMPDEVPLGSSPWSLDICVQHEGGPSQPVRAGTW